MPGKQKLEEVVIVGAGPVGLTTAVSLTLSGIPVRLFEAQNELPTDLRASSFHPPTLDLLSRFHIVDDLIAQGLPAPSWQFRDRETGPVATFEMSLLKGDTEHPFRLQCEQWKLARILKALFEKLGGRIEFGARVADVSQDDTSATIELGGERKGEKIRGRYIIAADGAYSVLRNAVRIPFEGFTYPELFLIVSTSHRFEDDLPDLSNINYISDPNEWLIMMHVPQFWRVNIPVSADGDQQYYLSDENVQAMLRRVFHREAAYEIGHRSLYAVHQKVAQVFRSGRVILVGDSAHLNNPIGGMGMNGGIHDSFNLTEKLVRIFGGEGDELLDQYDRQRRTVTNEAVQQQTIRNHKILSERDPAVRKASLDELRRTAEDPVLAREYLLKTSMIASLRRAASIQ